MSKERDCATKLRAIVGKEPFQTFVAKVTKVDGATCTVQRLFDDMELEEVRLNCHSTENEGVVIVPETGSMVLITSIDGRCWFVSQCSKVEKITIDATATFYCCKKCALLKQLARLYYMQGESQKVIADKVGVSAVTLGRWVETGGWKEKKAGMNVTRPEIVNKNLVLISRLLDRLNSEDIDLKDIGKIVDQVSKLAAAIERIDKKANVIDAIEVFTALNRWLEARMEWDEQVTPELLAQFSYYQDLYISEQVRKN